MFHSMVSKLKGEGHSRNGVFFEIANKKMGPKKRAHISRPLVLLYNLTSWTSGQAAKYHSKWLRTVLNFGPLWRGISVGSGAR